MNYEEMKEKLMEKYDRATRAIAVANDVDMGVAFDMLCTNVTKGDMYPYVKAEAKQDFEELLKIAGEEVKSSAENVAESAENAAE